MLLGTTPEEFMDYLNKGGIGLTVAPAEAHWLMGSEKSAIGVAKRIVRRLRKEESKFNVPDLFTLAAAAINTHIGASGSYGHVDQEGESWTMRSCSLAEKHFRAW